MLDSYEERRRFFRLRYGSAERPELVSRKGVWSISEISQAGARLIDCDGFPPGFSFVKIVLPSGATLETTASFCRLDNDEVVVTFDPPLPTTFVFEEQCRLLALQRSIGLAQTRL